MKNTFVYVIYCKFTNTAKFGYATDVHKRLSAIQNGNAHRLELLLCFRGGREEEKELHRRLHEYRLVGEWFTACVEVLEIFRQFQTEYLATISGFKSSAIYTLDRPMDVSILDVAYKFDKLFTVADLKKLLPSLALPTKDITDMLLDNGYVLKTYPSSRVKYFQKPKY